MPLIDHVSRPVRGLLRKLQPLQVLRPFIPEALMNNSLLSSHSTILPPHPDSQPAATQRDQAAEDVNDGVAQTVGMAQRTGAKDPLMTRTMAELVESQGDWSQAVRIYEGLLDQQPGDEVLQARLAQAKAERDKMAAAADGEESDDVSTVPEIGMEQSRQGELCLRWSLSQRHLNQARRLHGIEGRPVLRMYHVGIDAQRLRKETQHIDIEALLGETRVTYTPGTHITAAVGLLHPGGFVSIAHTQPRHF